jgi:hypothetical protein
MRFEVFTEVEMWIVVCWVIMTHCSFVGGFQCFRGLYCLHLQGLLMEAVHTCRVMVTAYKIMWHDQKDRNHMLNLHL